MARAMDRATTPPEFERRRARAAQYLRMSTERQIYSIDNQRDAIRNYAEVMGYDIVATYEDPGRSGLSILGRPGLKRLIEDIESRRADFETVVVYDVSRWGRFQNTDESASYEYRCQRAGVRIEFCAELFVNDGSIGSDVLKAIKRSMAAEYSRMLSNRVFAGQSRIIKLGFSGGGPAGYGYRRVLVDGSGHPKSMLHRNERKGLASDRVILVPGPENEVSTVRWMFNQFVKKGKTEAEIAAALNARGLVTEFGPDRVLDTPISEAGFTGIGVGAGMTGMRPVVDIMFGDFAGLIMDQMANQAAKIHYMSGGKWKCSMVLRTTLGATRRSAAQHSQSLHAWFCHIPGLKVVMPSTPYDAKGLLKSAIRDDNPVVFYEDKMMYKLKGPVPEEDYTIPLGVADVKRVGEDVTIIATSSMVQVALGAAKLLEGQGVSAEVVDPRTLWPLDEKTLIDSARKTSRVIVVDEGYGRYGVTAELAAVIQENAFFDLEAPVKRMGAMHVPIPFSPPLEDATVPTEKSVCEAAMVLCGK